MEFSFNSDLPKHLVLFLTYRNGMLGCVWKDCQTYDEACFLALGANFGNVISYKLIEKNGKIVYKRIRTMNPSSIRDSSVFESMLFIKEGRYVTAMSPLYEIGAYNERFAILDLIRSGSRQNYESAMKMILDSNCNIPEFNALVANDIWMLRLKNLGISRFPYPIMDKIKEMKVNHIYNAIISNNTTLCVRYATMADIILSRKDNFCYKAIKDNYIFAPILEIDVAEVKYMRIASGECSVIFRDMSCGMYHVPFEGSISFLSDCIIAFVKQKMPTCHFCLKFLQPIASMEDAFLRAFCDALTMSAYKLGYAISKEYHTVIRSVVDENSKKRKEEKEESEKLCEKMRIAFENGKQQNSK